MTALVPAQTPQTLRDRLACRDMTVDDVVTLLDFIANAPWQRLAAIASDDPDVQRASAIGTYKGLAYAAANALRRFDDAVRTAPPDALRDLIAAVAPCCRNEKCMRLAPAWLEVGAGYCSRSCEAEDLPRRSDEPARMWSL